MINSKLHVESCKFRASKTEQKSVPPFPVESDLTVRLNQPSTFHFELGTLLACAACYGKSDSPLAYGMNWGIFTLLGILTPVLGCFAFGLIHMIRKDEAARKNNDAPKNITDL